VAGPLKQYAFINAKLRARISKLLPDELINQMIRARTLTESIQLLKNTPFFLVEETYNRTGDLKMSELELFNQEVNLYLELERQLKGGVLDFVRALASRYEIDTLKNVLRLWFDHSVRGRPIEEPLGYLYHSAIHYDLHIDKIVKARDIEDLKAALKETPYGNIISRKAEEVAERKSVFPFEIALDHFFYRQLLSRAKQLKPADFKITKRFIGVEIDMQNINWLIRFKDFYNLSLEETLQYIIPHGYNVALEKIEQAYSSPNITEILSDLIRKKYGALSPFLTSQSSGSYARIILIERILEQIMLYEIRHVMAGYPFTIGIILAYFILKGNEIKKIMTILNAKLYKLPEERIKASL
jgi:V/A-type H+-transporting ATPase subunit C